MEVVVVFKKRKLLRKTAMTHSQSSQLKIEGRKIFQLMSVTIDI